ncbi:hypothetical protein [Ponticaulis koreensis]|uniref:hypothetical protein n=1 Tax=Ponticaulis koreensis TaxID=1123045 RepID=UPI0003B41844|nr:hypothetical protein [Ponticaulis koreensis]
MNKYTPLSYATMIEEFGDLSANDRRTILKSLKREDRHAVEDLLRAMSVMPKIDPAKLDTSIFTSRFRRCLNDLIDAEQIDLTDDVRTVLEVAIAKASDCETLKQRLTRRLGLGIFARKSELGV